MTTLIVVLNRRVLFARHGARWDLASTLEGHRFTCAVSDPRRYGIIYVGTNGGGLWRTKDGGASWDQAGKAPGSGFVTALAVDRHEHSSAGGTLYLGTEPSHFYRSRDGGGTWEEMTGLTALPSSTSWSFPPRPQTHHVRWIEPDPIVPGRILVAIEAGALVRTADGGLTWTDRVPDGPFDTHTMASHHIGPPGRFYAAAGDGYYETSDAGRTWTSDEAGLRHGYLVSVAVDPADPDTVVVSGSAGPFSAYSPSSAETYIYRRSAGGTWQRIGDGLPDPDGTTVSHFATTGESGLIYAANNRGVFVTKDAGRRWHQVDLPWEVRFEAEGVQALLALEV